VYIRYKQIEEFYRGKKLVWMDRVNTLAMVIGMISALGTIVVGSFQELNVITLHFVGAFMSFLGGAFYLIFQVTIFYN